MASFGSIKEGYLTKCGGKTKSWKKRWFILQENLMYYFASQKDMESKGTILLSKVVKVQTAPPALKKKNCFEVVTSERAFPMYAESEVQMKEWMDAINTINALHALRDTYKNRDHNMTDFYKYTLVTQSKQVLKFVATITGITKGLAGKHKWAKNPVNEEQIYKENETFGQAAIALVNDALSCEKDPYKPGPRKQMVSSCSYLRDLSGKLASYAEGGPNEASLKSIIKTFGDEIQKLIDTIQPTPKKEILHMMKSMGIQLQRYKESGNVDQRTAQAKKLEVIASEFPTVAKQIFNFIPDLTFAEPLVVKAEEVPKITKDVRELVKSAAFFSDTSRNATNATDTLFFVLNELRKITFGAFPKEEGDEMYPQVGPKNTQFKDDGSAPDLTQPPEPTPTATVIDPMQPPIGDLGGMDPFLALQPGYDPYAQATATNAAVYDPQQAALVMQAQMLAMQQQMAAQQMAMQMAEEQAKKDAEKAAAEAKAAADAAQAAKQAEVLAGFDSLLTGGPAKPSAAKVPAGAPAGGGVMDELDALLQFQMGQ